MKLRRNEKKKRNILTKTKNIFWNDATRNVQKPTNGKISVHINIGLYISMRGRQESWLLRVQTLNQYSHCSSVSFERFLRIMRATDQLPQDVHSHWMGAIVYGIRVVPLLSRGNEKMRWKKATSFSLCMNTLAMRECRKVCELIVDRDLWTKRNDDRLMDETRTVANWTRKQ